MTDLLSGKRSPESGLLETGQPALPCGLTNKRLRNWLGEIGLLGPVGKSNTFRGFGKSIFRAQSGGRPGELAADERGYRGSERCDPYAICLQIRLIRVQPRLVISYSRH